MPERITYSCSNPKFAPLAHKAAKEWNETLAGYVALVPVVDKADIEIVLATVNKSKDKTRVAECHDLPGKRWQIRLDPDTKWAVHPIARALGFGENALACLVHEFGHVFDLPHSQDFEHVMHREIGGNGKIPKAEREIYRRYFANNVNAD